MLCHEKKEAKYILGQKKESFKSWQRSPLVQSTLFHQLSKKVPYLVFDFDVFIFLSKIKAVGKRLFYPLSFLPKHNSEWLPCYSSSVALWVLSFASLKICSLYRNFYSKEARKAKIRLDNDNIGNEKNYWKISFHCLLDSSVIYL